MKRVLVFLAANALWLSGFVPWPMKSQAEIGKQGQSPQTAPSIQSGESIQEPHVTVAVSIHPQDKTTTLPPTVGGAIANNEFHNKLTSPISWSLSTPQAYGTTGIGRFHVSDGYLNVPRLKEYTGWRDTWRMIIPGNFGDSGTLQDDKWTDLIFYDGVLGGAELYVTNDSGEIFQKGNNLGWGPNWTQVVPGDFQEGGRTELLFYSQSNGIGEVHTVDNNGNHFLRSHNVGTGFDLVITGNFGKFPGEAADDEHIDIVLYKKSSGLAKFYFMDGNGNFFSDSTMIRIWDLNLHAIVPGSFGSMVQGTADKWTDLVFYNKATGRGDFYKTDGMCNRIHLNGWNWGTGYDLIIPGNFGNLVQDGEGAHEEPDDWTDLVLYSKTAPGLGDICVTDGLGHFSRQKRHGWGNGYDLIIPMPGNLGGSMWTDLLYYADGK